MPTIPRGIKAVVESYQIGSPEGVLRTEVGGGLPRYSLDWDKGCQPFRVSVPLRPQQLVMWTLFFHHTTKEGTIPFDMPLDEGFGPQIHSVQVVPGTYSASRRGEVTTATFTVMARSSFFDMSEAAAQALIDAYNGYAPGVTPAMPRGFQPVVESYGFTGPDGGVSSEVPGGLPAYALSWERGAQQFRVTLVLTATQFQVWAAFFLYSIRKGAISFEMPLDSGLGVATHLVNVMPGTHSAVRVGVLWTVSFGVEAQSNVYGMSSADAAAMLDLYDILGDEMDALLARIDKFANQDTRVLP